MKWKKSVHNRKVSTFPSFTVDIETKQKVLIRLANTNVSTNRDAHMYNVNGEFSIFADWPSLLDHPLYHMKYL